MRNKLKINFLKEALSLLLLIAIIFSCFFGNVENVSAESSLNLASSKASVVEHLKLDVPEKFKQAWLKAEKGSWEIWLPQKEGFLGRQLFWDPKTEEATLLIGWKSRSVWKNIPQTEINLVQLNFEKIARLETGITEGNPFPLIYEGELIPE